MSIVQEIKQRLDIVEVVSEFIPLHRVGRYYRALCPFHAERHPSFYVLPETQRWHCFGACSTGGDIFSFVMRKENLTFSEALKFLAQKAGVKLTAPEERKEDKRLYQLNEAAASFYHQKLLHSPEAFIARNYFKQRAISMESILSFGLGYSPRQGGLKNHLLSLEFSEEEMVRGGLLREDGWELFRGRLLFPIKDIQGRVVGFGARSLDDTPPKYLNSPATSIFDKGSLLYGLDKAKESIRKEAQVILVEGYIDVIIAHQYGFKNVVGTLGVALTEKQLRQLKGSVKNIILALDMDRAGIEATLRGVELIDNALGETTPIPDWRGLIRYEDAFGGEIKVLTLPEGKDPDEIIREGRWNEFVYRTIPVLDFLIEILSSQYDLSKLEGRTDLVNKLKPLLGQIKDPIKWSYYIQKLAAKLNMEERWLAAAFKVKEKDKRFVSASSSAPHSLEEECLAFLLAHPELRDSVNIPPEYFLETANREIFLAWKACPEPAVIGEYLPTELGEQLERLLKGSLPEVEEGRVLKECLSRLKENFLRHRLKLEKEILSVGETSTARELRQLLKERRTKWGEVGKESN